MDLIFAEYPLREERDRTPTLAEFLERFPTHAAELELQIALHDAIESGDALGDMSDAVTTTIVGHPPCLPDIDGVGSTPPSVHYPSIPGYEILDELGRGGMGVVYRAWQSELKRFVAIKMVHAGAQAAPALLARFRVVAEAVARLRHPNIVQIHDVGQYSGAPYLVLELVDGVRFAESLGGTPQLAGKAAELTETLARTIDSAHRLGVVHRDLSPSNIMVSADGALHFCFDAGMTRYAVRLRSQTLVVCRFADDQEIGRFACRGDRGFFVLAFSPDGRYLMTTHFPGYALTVSDVDGGTVALEEPGPVSGRAGKFSPDSRRIALARQNGEILIRDLQSGQARKVRSVSHQVHDLAFRPDGTQIAVTDGDGKDNTCSLMDI